MPDIRFRRVATLRCIVLLLLAFPLVAGPRHPRVFATDADREAVLDKIKNYDWARKLYNGMVGAIAPYATRHLTDPAWILSRVTMNWARPFYTNHDRGTVLIDGQSYSAVVARQGNAPLPTFRPLLTRFNVLTPAGYQVRVVNVDKMRPFSANGKHPCTSTDPFDLEIYEAEASLTHVITGMARDAAFLYWLTRDDKFGRFAADILHLIGETYHLQTFDGTATGPTAGKVTWETIQDAIYLEALAIAYDFAHDYMVTHQNERTVIEVRLDGVGPVVERLEYPVGTNANLQKTFDSACAIMVNRGNRNNWALKENVALVAGALVLDDPARRDFFMSRYLDVDVPKHMPMSSFSSNYDDVGYWNETPGYHMPIGNDAIAAERHGDQVFRRFPNVIRSASALVEYTFPNGSAPNIGDGGTATVNGQVLDAVYGAAVRFGSPEAERLLPHLQKAISLGIYTRGALRTDSMALNSPNFMVLLYGVDVVPPRLASALEKPETSTLQPRVWGTNTFNSILVKAGSSSILGMGFSLSGGYLESHAHYHGPDLELFGRGNSLVTVPGRITTFYGSDLGQQYLMRPAGHNAIIVNKVSLTNGRLRLVAADPRPGEEAISRFCAFTTVGYYDATVAAQADQLRTVGFVRTRGDNGFAFDIFRSRSRLGGTQTHDWLLHLRADGVRFEDFSNRSLSLDAPGSWSRLTSVQDTDFVGTGVSWFTDVRKVTDPGHVKAVSMLKDRTTQRDIELSAWMRAPAGREFFLATSPRAVTAPAQYNAMDVPVLVARQNGEAWSAPFCAVMEPSFAGSSLVRDVRYGGDSVNDLVTIQVDQWNAEVSQVETIHILSATNEQRVFSNAGGVTGLTFQGHLGIVCTRGGKVKWLYLGRGRSLQIAGAESPSSTTGSTAWFSQFPREAEAADRPAWALR